MLVRGLLRLGPEAVPRTPGCREPSSVSGALSVSDALGAVTIVTACDVPHIALGLRRWFTTTAEDAEIPLRQVQYALLDDDGIAGDASCKPVVGRLASPEVTVHAPCARVELAEESR